MIENRKIYEPRLLIKMGIPKVLEKEEAMREVEVFFRDLTVEYLGILRFFPKIQNRQKYNASLKFPRLLLFSRRNENGT